jgi:hypothetical protein
MKTRKMSLGVRGARCYAVGRPEAPAGLPFIGSFSNLHGPLT